MSDKHELRLIMEKLESDMPTEILDEILNPEIKKEGDDLPSRLVINLRGSKFTIQSKYLARFPKSVLSKKGADLNPGENEIYFDHNPTLFHFIWDVYINGTTHMPENFCPSFVEKELEFWSLDKSILSQCCWDRLMEGHENNSMLNTVIDEWERADRLKERSHTMTWVEYTHLFLEEPRISKWAQLYSIVIMLIAIGSIITWLLESLPSCRTIIEGKDEHITNATHSKVDTYLRFSIPAPTLWYMDIVAALLLTLDYILRFSTSPNKCRFMITMLNVADLLGLVPILIMIGMEFYHMSYTVDDDFLHAMYILNIMRVLRVLRMFRMIQHFKPLKIVFWAWKASYKELILLVIIISVFSCVFGSIIYYAELYEDNIITIPHGMWWAIVTMTTVGYGDVVPATPVGYLVGCFCAITGILVIAMPIPVIVQNFSRYYDAVQTTDRIRKNETMSKRCTTLRNKLKQDSAKNKNKVAPHNNSHVQTKK